MQGAAIYNGIMYQFRGAGTANNNIPTYDMYNVSTSTWTKGESLTGIEGSHMGSANFGTKIFTEADGYSHKCTKPFVYITNKNTIQIYDLENKKLVATWTLPALDDDAIAAFDFANRTLWSIGYPSGSRKAPYLIRELTGIDFNVVPTDRTIADNEFKSKTTIGGPDSEDKQHDLKNGTLQDAQYVNGIIYFCTGGGSSYHRTEYTRIHAYNTQTKELVDTKLCVDNGESEGLVYDATSQSFYMTVIGTNNIWKLSSGSAYDANNFEPATLEGEYYQISNASQLLWFKQQLYSGCTYAKAKLTSNIDMSGVTDPFSYYVYDINMPTKRVYDATNAFRGEFDGNGKAIENYNITSTPYNNNGLFPYVQGAYIHDLTVRGTIKLSTCTTADGSKQPVSNVGFIGTMDGGTLENVATTGITIDDTLTPGAEGTISKFIGNKVGNVNIINCSEDCTTLLKGRYFSKANINSHASSPGNLQGAAFLSAANNGIDHKDRIYVFKQRPASKDYEYLNSYDYYDIESNTWNTGESFTYATNIHMGSASFGPNVLSSYVGSDGKTYKCTIPFVYVTGHTYVDNNGNIATSGKKYIVCAALDLQNHRIVKIFTFPDRADDCIMAYDFTGGRLWVIGYQVESSVGKAPYVVDEYRRVNMSDFLSGNPTRWNYADITPQTITLKPGGGTDTPIVVPEDGSPFCLRVKGGGPNSEGIQESLECGTVQDAFYYDNHIYMCTGRGSLYNRTEYVKIHCYYVAEKEHDYDITIVAPSYGESQGLVFDGTNIWLNVARSGDSETGGLYKYSPSQTIINDNMNFQPAKEVYPKTTPATYNITNGYELCWFLQQAYGGCTTIKAVLANDIDMNGITLPTSFYVKDLTDSQMFEANYPFRGSFNGNGHTISNLFITQTPYYNDGLFPYIDGATITDVKVNGTINLSKASHETEGETDVENVGFIGKAIGNCTVTGLDVSNLLIVYPDGITTSHIHQLIGNDSQKGAESVIKNNIFAGDHGEDGSHHDYNSDGICVANGPCNAKYKAPDLKDEIYQITTAGNLWWFATNINNGGIAASSKAILVNDIEMRGSRYGSFPGIGNSTNIFSGIFDGNNKTINNIYLVSSGGRYGLFGTANNATIKQFAINGTLLLTGTTDKFFNGAVVGQAGGTTLVQDIISSVNITLENGVRGCGGIIGCALNNTSTIIDRCRYSGTITVNGIEQGYPQSTGGIVGDLRKGKVTNCLFDGTIITTIADPTGENQNINVAGIIGNNANAGNTVSNCLSHGTITIKDNTQNHCAIMVGWNRGATTSANNYFTTTNVSSTTGTVAAVGVGASNMSTAPDEVTKEEDLTNNILLFNLQKGVGKTSTYANWKAGTNYPVPGIGEILKHVHTYAENNGVCTVEGCEEVYQPANYNEAENVYEIGNKGQYYSFVKITKNNS